MIKGMPGMLFEYRPIYRKRQLSNLLTWIGSWRDADRLYPPGLED